MDDKNYLIIAAEVTSEACDLGSLYPTIKAASDIIKEVKGANLLADKGYFSNEDIKACEDAGYQSYIPEKGCPMEGKGFYGKPEFVYNEYNNTYTCPAGKTLQKFQNKRKDYKTYWIYKSPEACINCPLKAKCTKSQSRSIQRWEHEQVLENVRKRMNAKPNIMKRRSAIVEHPFGTIKRHILTGGYNMIGIESAQAETSLAQLTYNLNRVLNIVNFSEIMSFLKGRKNFWQKYAQNHLVLYVFRVQEVIKWLFRKNNYLSPLLVVF